MVEASNKNYFASIKIIEEDINRLQIPGYMEAETNLFYAEIIREVSDKETAISKLITVIKNNEKHRDVGVRAARIIIDIIEEEYTNPIEKLVTLKNRSQDLNWLPAMAHRKIADHFLNTGKKVIAANELRQMVYTYQKSPMLVIDAAKKLTKLEEEESRFDAAEKVLRDLYISLPSESEQNPKKKVKSLLIEHLLKRAESLLKEKEPALAIKEYRKIISLSPLHISAHKGLIDAYFLKHKIAEIQSKYDLLSSKNPNSSEYLYFKGYACTYSIDLSSSTSSKLDWIDTCIDILKEANSINSKISEIHQTLGWLYRQKNIWTEKTKNQKGFWSSIKRSFNISVEYFFPSPNLLELATDSYLSAYYLTDTNSIAQANLAQNLGETYYDMKNYKKALNYYIQRIRLLSTFPIRSTKAEALILRKAGRAAFQIDEFELSETLYQRSLKRWEKSGREIEVTRTLDFLALAYMKLKKYKKAAAIYERLHAINNRINNYVNSAINLINLAYTHYKMKRYDSALEMYYQAYSILETHGSNLNITKKDNIGISLGGSNTDAAGFDQLSQFIQIKSFIARIYEKLGQQQLALKAYLNKKSLQENKKDNNSKKTYYNKELAITNNNIGNIYNKMGLLNEASAAYLTAFNYGKSLAQEESKIPLRAEWLNLVNYGYVLLKKGVNNDINLNEINEAIALYNRYITSINSSPSPLSKEAKSILIRLVSIENQLNILINRNTDNDSLDKVVLYSSNTPIPSNATSGLLLLANEIGNKSNNPPQIQASEIMRDKAASKSTLLYKYFLSKRMWKEAYETIVKSPNIHTFASTNFDFKVFDKLFFLIDSKIQNSSKKDKYSRYQKHLFYKNLIFSYSQFPINTVNTKLRSFLEIKNPGVINNNLDNDEAIITIVNNPYSPKSVYLQTRDKLLHKENDVSYKSLDILLKDNPSNIKHLYVVGNSYSLAFPWTRLNINSISFIGAPSEIVHLKKNRTIQKLSILELVPNSNKASKKKSTTSSDAIKTSNLNRMYSQKQNIAQDLKNKDILHISNSTNISIHNPKYSYIANSTNNRLIGNSLIGDLIKYRYNNTITIFAKTSFYNSQSKSKYTRWDSLQAIYLTLVGCGSSSITFNISNSELDNNFWGSFYDSLSKESIGQISFKNHRNIITLGYSGLGYKKEVLFARKSLNSALKKGSLRKALYYANILKNDDTIDDLLLKIRLEDQKRRDYKSALYFQEKIIERTPEDEELDLADELLTAGSLAYYAREYEKAKGFLSKAQKIFEEEEELEGLGLLHKRLALIFEKKKMYQEAIKHFIISRKYHLQDEDEEQATVRLLDIGNIYNLHLSDYGNALTYYDLAIKEYENQDDDEYTQKVLIDKANTLITIGQIKEAIFILEGILDDIDIDDEDEYDEDDEDFNYWARTSQILSNAYFRAALFQEALNINERILKKTTSVTSSKSARRYLDATNLKAMIIAKLGNFDDAMEVFLEGVDIAQKFNLSDKLSLRYNNIGYWYREFGQIDNSITYLNKALEIDTNLKNQTAIAYDLRNLGLSQILADTLKPARANLEKAKSISKELNLSYNAAYAEFGLGDLSLKEKNWRLALNHFNEALTISKKGYLQDFIWKAHASIGYTLSKMDNLERASEHYKSSIEIIESLRAGLTSRSSKSGFQADKGVQGVYSEYVTILMKLKKIESAWSISERSRSRAFIDSLASQTPSFSDAAKNKILRNFKNLQNSIEITKRRLHRTPKNSKLYSALTNESISQKKLFNKYTSTVKNNYPDLMQFLMVESISLKDLSILIPKNVSIVEYMLTADHIYIWVIQDGKISGKTVSYKTSFLEKNIDTFRNLLQHYSSLKYLGKDLADTLIEPIYDLIKDSNHLAIVPHGSLHYLAFSALPLETGYLLDKFSIHYLESSSIAKFTHSSKSKNINLGSQILAFGNPSLGKELDLPFAKKEAEVIPRYFPNTKVLTGEMATEESFRSLAYKYEAIHIASHGEFNANMPSHSRLKLTPNNNYDGNLTVNEVFSLKLKAKLVTLSACETGLGKISSGDEIIGLNRAFFFAGTKSLLSTLWRINDVASAIIIKRFYRYLAQGLPKDEALRKSQLLVRKYFPHPAYWSSYRLLGYNK